MTKKTKTNPSTNRHQAETEGEPGQPMEGDKVETGHEHSKGKTKINTHNPPPQEPQQQPPKVLTRDYTKQGEKYQH